MLAAIATTGSSLLGSPGRSRVTDSEVLGGRGVVIVTLILSGGVFLLAQLGFADSFWPLAGYAVAALLVIGAYLNHQAKAVQERANRLIEEHAARFGDGSVRDFVQGFGEGFGEEYAKGSIDGGDWVGALIGLGVHWLSGQVKDIGKSPEQLASEQRIAKVLAVIEKQEGHGGIGCFTVVGVCVLAYVLVAKGVLPLAGSPEPEQILLAEPTPPSAPAKAEAEPAAVPPPCDWHKDCREYEENHRRLTEVNAALIARTEQNILEESDLAKAKESVKLARRLRAISCAKMKKKPKALRELCRSDRAMVKQVKKSERLIRRYVKKRNRRR